MKFYRDLRVVGVGSYVFAVINLMAASACVEAQTPIDSASLIRAHEEYKAKLHSAKAHVVEESEATPVFYKYKGETPPATQEAFKTEYTWAFKGRKVYTLTEDSGPAGATLAEGGPVSREIIFDGERTFTRLKAAARPGEVMTDSTAEKVKMGRTAHHSPLEFGYVTATGEWIADALKADRFTFRQAESHPVFGPLVEGDGTERNSQIIRLWFAPNHGMLAVRSQFENTQAHTTDTFEAVELKRVGNIDFPVAGQRMWRDAQGQLLTKSSFRVSEVTLNDVQDALFDVKPSGPGSYWDADSRERYRVDAKGNLIKLPPIASADSAGYPMKWVFFLSGTTLTLFGIGALVKWRRGSLSA